MTTRPTDRQKARQAGRKAGSCRLIVFPSTCDNTFGCFTYPFNVLEAELESILGRVHVDEWSDVDSKLLISLTEKSAMDFLTDFLLLFASNIAHRNETNETDTLIATLFDGHHFPGVNSLRSVHYHFRHPRRSPLF